MGHFKEKYSFATYQSHLTYKRTRFPIQNQLAFFDYEKKTGFDMRHLVYADYKERRKIKYKNNAFFIRFTKNLQLFIKEIRNSDSNTLE